MSVPTAIVVFTPKYRKKLLFGKIKRHLGQVFHDLARRKECRKAARQVNCKRVVLPKRTHFKIGAAQ